MNKFNCKLVTWQEIENWTKTVVTKIKNSTFTPDLIVALSRGGLVPARLISDSLLIKDLYAVKTEHWGITATLDGEAKLTQKLDMSIKSRNVLIVDDITDTGKSLKLALSHIASMSPDNLKTATLLHITHAVIEPDFYAEKVPKTDWTWFIFPWNIHEDLYNLVPKTLINGPLSLKQIRTILKLNFNILVPMNILKESLINLKFRGVVMQSGYKWALKKQKL